MLRLTEESARHEAAQATCDPVTVEIIRGAIRAVQAEMEALLE